MLALAADTADLPQELARHEDRLARLAEAKAMMEARARERFASEQAEHEAKLKARAEKQRATGKKSDGKPPAPPTAGLGARDQINLTDEDSRIMLVAGGGFEQAFNAQATVRWARCWWWRAMWRSPRCATAWPPPKAIGSTLRKPPQPVFGIIKSVIGFR